MSKHKIEILMMSGDWRDAGRLQTFDGERWNIALFDTAELAWQTAGKFYEAEIAAGCVRVVPAPEALPELRASQIKAGDVLIREKDHIGRPDHRITVTSKVKGAGPLRFNIEGRYGVMTAKSLTAENYCVIERDGVRIGRFFVTYW